jgi:hypothetical protein
MFSINVVPTQVASPQTEGIETMDELHITKMDIRKEKDEIAGGLMLDYETYILLEMFQESFLLGVCDIELCVDRLKPYAPLIKRMGPIFAALGLAKRMKGTAFAWEPRRNLGRIIATH